VVAYRLNQPGAAAEHLEYCIARRPANAMLRVQLAGCYYDALRFDAALEQCKQALLLNPDQAAAYRTRAYVRFKLGQEESRQADIKRFELLTRNLGKLPAWRLRLEGLFIGWPERAAIANRDPTDRDLLERILSADPDDVDLRTDRALQLKIAGRKEEALAECDWVLEINPAHLRARYLRGLLLYQRGNGESEADFTYVVDHPRFGEFLSENTRPLFAFYADSIELLRKGEADRALEMARRGLSYAQRFNDTQMQGRMHYALACAYAAGAMTASEQIQQSAAHLFIASQYDRDYLGAAWFYQDPFFEGRRSEIAYLIPEVPDAAQ
jgi:tetratricopeptide (TPR) repeat protein